MNIHPPTSEQLSGETTPPLTGNSGKVLCVSVPCYCRRWDRPSDRSPPRGEAGAPAEVSASVEDCAVESVVRSYASVRMASLCFSFTWAIACG